MDAEYLDTDTLIILKLTFFRRHVVSQNAHHHYQPTHHDAGFVFPIANSVINLLPKFVLISLTPGHFWLWRLKFTSFTFYSLQVFKISKYFGGDTAIALELLVRACACAIGVFQTRWYHYNHWLFLFFSSSTAIQLVTLSTCILIRINSAYAVWDNLDQ